MASAKAKIRHVFGDTFSCRAAPPDILVKLSGFLSLQVFTTDQPRSRALKKTFAPLAFAKKFMAWLFSGKNQR